MKRKASMAFVIALCAALAMTGAVAAKDHPAHGSSGGSDTASLNVKGNASHPGSVLRVHAVLHASKDLRPQTINAVVHFATGDVAVVLTRSGNGSAYHGNVPVPAGEPSGDVKIDATAVVDGATVTATGRGKIIAKTDSETTETSTTSTETTETTTTSTDTTTTCTTTTTETVTTTVTSTASETSTTTETTDSDESSEESESSEASESSEDDDSDSCEHELRESTDSPAFVLTPETIRAFFALLAAFIG